MSRITGIFGRFAHRLDRRGRRAEPPLVAPPRADEDEIVVSYEPRRDGDADPGEVVWGWVAYEDDPTQGKDRPIVVLGRWGRDLCGVPLTSKSRPGDPDRILVGTGGWDPQRRPSYACMDRVMRLAPSAVRREGSALDRRAFERVVDGFRDPRS
jgi:hypothetical protein